jgi:branched-chain amino acid transport system permease protein
MSPRIATFLNMVIYLTVMGALLWLASTYLNNYYLRVLAVIAINIMLTVSLNLTNGFAGDFSLGSAAFMAIGAYTSALLTLPAATKVAMNNGLPAWLQQATLPFVVATVAGGLMAAAVAAVVGIPVLRLRGHYLAVATLGLTVIVRAVAINWQPVTRGARGLNGLPADTNIWWAYGWVVLTIYLVWRLVNSPYGRGMIANREDYIAARARGVRVFRARMLAFVVSAALTGAAGALWAHLITAITPNSFTVLMTFNIVVMLVVGGMGSISGSVIGAILLTLLPEALRRVETSLAIGGVPLYGLSQIVIAVLAAAVMLYRRQGLLGGRELRLPAIVRPGAKVK